MPAFSQPLLNLLRAISKGSFSLICTLGINFYKIVYNGVILLDYINKAIDLTKY
jgi:hypothetical protein